jgi:hypothetical protein
MNRKPLNIIDFSDGIRSEEIRENFDMVESQLNRQNLSIAGYGVASGLNMSIADFKLKITSGVVIDNTGQELFYDNTEFNIALPITELTTETVTVQTGGVINISSIPYCPDGKAAADTVTPDNISNSLVTGITVLNSNDGKQLSVKAIASNVVTIDARYAGLIVNVKYYYTSNRIDTIYINSNLDIAIAQGTQSTSPSGYIPNDLKYILGFLDIRPFTITDGKMKAALSLRNDLRRLRNVYTDTNNFLYLCGTRFDDLQIVHMSQPVDPIENTLWYDAATNNLLVWRTTKGISEWVNVNDTSFVPVLESKIWTMANLDELHKAGKHDLQTFKFNLESDPVTNLVPDLNMLFKPDKHELEVIIDNAPLMSDQFIEIVQDDPHEKYQNNGIGFKLVEPLDRPVYVEARVTHRVNHNDLPERLQRSATFSIEDSQLYSTSNTQKIFNTPAPYLYGETQLEVFVEGKKLVNGVDFLEGADLDSAHKVKGAYTNQFQIIRSISVNDRVACKVTACVYSYDNVISLLGNLGQEIDNAVKVSNVTSAKVDAFTADVNQDILDIQAKVNAAETKAAEIDNAIKKDAVLDKANIPAYINSFIPSGLINVTIVKNASIMVLTGITDKDYINVFDINTTGGNSILRRDVDYSIEKGDDNNYYIHFLGSFDNSTTDNHDIYISGIKLGV